MISWDEEIEFDGDGPFIVIMIGLAFFCFLLLTVNLDFN
jgi:hypothetical protein